MKDSLRELFCGLTEDELTELMRQVQAGEVSIPIVAEIKTVPLKCDLCGSEIQDTDAAIEDGWAPSYYEDESSPNEILQPICLQCSIDKCYTSDGELVLKPVAVQPLVMSDYGRYLPPKQLFRG